jgi:hypothetical protein
MTDARPHRSAVAAVGMEIPRTIDRAHVGRARGNGARQACTNASPAHSPGEIGDSHAAFRGERAQPKRMCSANLRCYGQQATDPVSVAVAENGAANWLRAAARIT